ncbi:hypothetical protein [Limnospira platensis]|uniref:hypothetical protein n=1 Tax=Limnospira platensis TaxID=118562 RepID=UPI0001D0E6C0|nr:hypothetical protein [Arthrospira platensis]MDF2207293.1 hypothetical protein [Arthrospira platensis NCB002]QQW32315.1 hypothetical protein AP9108_23235 [Arthrospira sp. PCC 9108]BAI92622.1 hypothetical protein NIES39_L04650 [Arthrospira platensis NIES-39]MDF2211882.1 hypothetical protein [Arthrospira platensis NCB002]QQW32327.1 hypothetical protein AP9108_27580 [Arthrospira sp. PCC 9108]
MYIDNLVGSPYGYLRLPTAIVLTLSHTLPLTETSTIGETNDVIAVNGEERTDRLAIDGYHKGVTLSVFG